MFGGVTPAITPSSTERPPSLSMRQASADYHSTSHGATFDVQSDFSRMFEVVEHAITGQDAICVINPVTGLRINGMVEPSEYFAGINNPDLQHSATGFLNCWQQAMQNLSAVLNSSGVSLTDRQLPLTNMSSSNFYDVYAPSIDSFNQIFPMINYMSTLTSILSSVLRVDDTPRLAMYLHTIATQLIRYIICYVNI